MKKIVFFASVLAVLGLTACEETLDVGEDNTSMGQVKNSVLQVRTRGASGDGATVAYPVAVFVFQGDECKGVQTIGDEGQTLNIALTEGTYQLVVIAHNAEGSATITSTEKVTFPNNKVTDTFYYYGDLVVTSEVQSYDLTLTRAVAMFRLVLTDDEIPSTVSKFKFYYTGGSSTFSPSAGYGCVNSKQTEIRTVADDGVYEIFTLPHTEEDVLTKLTITALDANDNTVKERIFENIPVTRNQITRYTGSFFGSGGSGQTSDGTFRLTADPDWDSVNGYTF